VQPSHISARLPDTPYVVVKTRGGGGAGVTRDQVCLVDLDGRALAGGGEPPLELPLHLEIYRRRHDVTSVGHTHQPAATALLGSANSGRTDIPTYPFPDQIRTAEQGADLARTLDRAAMVHMRDHGLAITGTSIEDVVAQAVELETWARNRSR
jgi:ribulose-5-phosphate 4-epimerase/fuculose-1-phosphate aldolase